MESTANVHFRATRNHSPSAQRRVQEADRNLKTAGAEELHSLFAHVEDLVARLGDSLDPEITRIRTKVESGLTEARRAISAGAEQMQRQAQEAVTAGRQFVSDNPWQVFGLAAGAGMLLGFFVARR
jgi:ElaB/YqjD/DUF883 family membrane-anchored ribosome-binding protein